MAVSQLVLYLIYRFHSRELALATGKLMMIELNLNNQSRFYGNPNTGETNKAYHGKLNIYNLLVVGAGSSQAQAALCQNATFGGDRYCLATRQILACDRRLMLKES